MVMIRPKGKSLAVSERVMKSKGVKVRKTDQMEKTKVKGPYLQH